MSTKRNERDEVRWDIQKMGFRGMKLRHMRCKKNSFKEKTIKKNGKEEKRE